MKKRKFIFLILSILLAALFILNIPAAAEELERPMAQSGVPQVVSYQGQVTINGATYNGIGYFKFAVVNAAGDTTYWDNDGTGVGEPTNAVQLVVTNGLFNVLLGDTALSNMTALPASAFDGTDRHLRVWFSSDGATFTLLSPDQRIAAVPYALQAEEAKNAATAGNADTLDGQLASEFASSSHNHDETYVNEAQIDSITSVMITDSTITFVDMGQNGCTSGQVIQWDGTAWVCASGAESSWSLNGNAGTDSETNFLGTTDNMSLTVKTNNISALFINPSQDVGIGTNAPTEKLTVLGNAQVLGYDAPAALGFATTNLPRAVAVAGNYAYVVSEDEDSLSVFDISNPNTITARGVTTTGLDVARAVAVSGDYAYVASYYNKRLVIFDVSDPDNIVWVGDAYVYGPNAVTVSGRYAYVVSYNDRLDIFDVSDPANPISVGAITSDNMDNPTSVFVVGRYAYVTNYYSPYLSIFDISDPSNIIPRGYTDTDLYTPYSVVVVGHYAYVASWWNHRLVTLDISDPNNPIVLDYISTNLSRPLSVVVTGDYAYVASSNNDTLAVFDVSDPSNLVALGFTSENLDEPESVFVAGRYAYVASHANSQLVVFDLNHLEAPTADIGSLHTGGLHVGESAIVGSNLNVQDSLNVGTGGALINGDVSVQGNLFAHVSVTTVTGSTTLLATHSGVVLVNNDAATTITLPDAASSSGLTFTIKCLTANAVTVASAGGTIDGAASQSLAAQYDFVSVVSDGSNWYITGR